MSTSTLNITTFLPFPENLILKYFAVPYYLKKYDVRFASSDYEKMTKLIIRLANSVELEKLKQQIKIKRYFGIEEVSTNWSISMVLEHLILAGEGFKEIIKQLNTQGKTSIIANPALIKPKGLIEDPLKSFQDHIENYKNFIASIDFSKNQSSKGLHPWIGYLTQKKWHTFTVIHLQVHLRQVKLIIDQLNSAKAH